MTTKKDEPIHLKTAIEHEIKIKFEIPNRDRDEETKQKDKSPFPQVLDTEFPFDTLFNDYVNKAGNLKITLPSGKIITRYHSLRSFLLAEKNWIKSKLEHIKWGYYFDLLISYEDFLDNKLSKAVVSHTKPDLTGFQSTLTDKQIQTLFDQLKGNYIDKNTNTAHFKAIFRYKPLPDNCKIQWLKTNVLLAYLIKKLFHFDNYLNVWVKAENIFIKDNEPIKNLRKSETNNPYPKGYDKIDVILKSIYTPLR